MAKLKAPRPGMGQDEKDKLGQALHEQAQRDLELDEAARTLGDWRPDSELPGMTADQLRTEATVRRVALAKNISNDDAVRRLEARRKEVESWRAQRQEAAGTPPTGERRET